MEVLYRLAGSLGPIDRVDSLEQVTGCSVHLPQGAEFRIFRGKHKWAVPWAPEFDYYTIQHAGMHYVLANQLEPRMEQIEPPVLRTT